MKRYQFELIAQTPAKLAEEFIVKSIWFKNFPAGTDLMAERELAEIIGVTRTTLREVLQCLARDGWLKIQHGRPTKVNDIWRTGGTNVVSTLLSLDEKLFPLILNNFLTLRKTLSHGYIPEAVKDYNDKACEIFQHLTIPCVDESAQVFAEFDYALYHTFAFASNKPVYGLILNSFHSIYLQLAKLFFAQPQSQIVAREFYFSLKKACSARDFQVVHTLLDENHKSSQLVWKDILTSTSPDMFNVFMM